MVVEGVSYLDVCVPAYLHSKSYSALSLSLAESQRTWQFSAAYPYYYLCPLSLNVYACFKYWQLIGFKAFP